MFLPTTMAAHDELPPTWKDDFTGRLKAAGAAMVGFADLTCLPGAVRADLPRAISVAIALDPAVVAELVHGPTPRYHAEYDRANALLGELANLAVTELRQQGFSSRSGAVTVRVVRGDGATPLPHKTVATRAGLGWIGVSALLITRNYGAAVRLASVLTDAPFVCDEPEEESRCGTCRACLDACPANAFTGEAWRPGIPRERIVDVACVQGQARMQMPQMVTSMPWLAASPLATFWQAVGMAALTVSPETVRGGRLARRPDMPARSPQAPATAGAVLLPRHTPRAPNGLKAEQFPDL
jgi:ferredoxin